MTHLLPGGVIICHLIVPNVSPSYIPTPLMYFLDPSLQIPINHVWSMIVAGVVVSVVTSLNNTTVMPPTLSTVSTRLHTGAASSQLPRCSPAPVLSQLRRIIHKEAQH